MVMAGAFSMVCVLLRFPRLGQCIGIVPECMFRYLYCPVSFMLLALGLIKCAIIACSFKPEDALLPRSMLGIDSTCSLFDHARAHSNQAYRDHPAQQHTPSLSVQYYWHAPLAYPTLVLLLARFDLPRCTFKLARRCESGATSSTEQVLTSIVTGRGHLHT